MSEYVSNAAAYTASAALTVVDAAGNAKESAIVAATSTTESLVGETIAGYVDGALRNGWESLLSEDFLAKCTGFPKEDIEMYTALTKMVTRFGSGDFNGGVEAAANVVLKLNDDPRKQFMDTLKSMGSGTPLFGEAVDILEEYLTKRLVDSTVTIKDILMEKVHGLVQDATKNFQDQVKSKIENELIAKCTGFPMEDEAMAKSVKKMITQFGTGDLNGGVEGAADVIQRLKPNLQKQFMDSLRSMARGQPIFEDAVDILEEYLEKSKSDKSVKIQDIIKKKSRGYVDYTKKEVKSRIESQMQ